MRPPSTLADQLLAAIQANAAALDATDWQCSPVEVRIEWLPKSTRINLTAQAIHRLIPSVTKNA